MADKTNRYKTKETTRKKEVAEPSQNVGEMVVKKVHKKMMSMNVDPELYEKFQFITRKLSTNASAVLNEYMYSYVKEHSDLL